MTMMHSKAENALGPCLMFIRQKPRVIKNSGRELLSFQVQKVHGNKIKLGELGV